MKISSLSALCSDKRTEDPSRNNSCANTSEHLNARIVDFAVLKIVHTYLRPFAAAIQPYAAPGTEGSPVRGFPSRLQ